MVLSLRKKEFEGSSAVGKIMIPVLESSDFRNQIKKVEHLILHEVNVKEISFVEDSEGVLVKRIKPDFKILGPKYGKIMKSVAARISDFTQKEISTLEKEESMLLRIEDQDVEIKLSDVEIFADDIPGWVVTNQGALTVALDITVTEELKQEGYARELVNRIQNYRKESQLDVVDTISIDLQSHSELDASFNKFESYIKSETLCTRLNIVSTISADVKTTFEIAENLEIEVAIRKN